MAVNIVTGMTGQAHITSDDDRMSNASVFGTEKHVFPFGQQFRAEVMNNNLVRIRDGYCINQGTMMAVELSDYEDVVIENGISGLNRNDLIVMRYEKNADTSLESARLVVIKGVQSENATDPAYQSGNILDGGDLLDDYPLYRVRVESLTIAVVEPLFAVWENDLSNTFDNVNGLLHGIKNNVDKSLEANRANVASQLEAHGISVTNQLSAQNETVTNMVNAQKERLETQDENVTNRLEEFGNILEPYQKGAVSGIKGNAESEYRTGNVNLTPQNLGLDNTKDVNKTVRALGKSGSEYNGAFQEGMEWKGSADSVSKLNDRLLFARHGGGGGMWYADPEEIRGLLDAPYYEEGLWTPDPYNTSGSSVSCFTAYGRYARIGKLVYIEGSLTCKTSTVIGKILGLPFAPSVQRPSTVDQVVIATKQTMSPIQKASLVNSVTNSGISWGYVNGNAKYTGDSDQWFISGCYMTA